MNTIESFHLDPNGELVVHSRDGSQRPATERDVAEILGRPNAALVMAWQGALAGDFPCSVAN